MKTDYTHIVMVLDRSGSMGAIASDTIGGFNRFIEDQRYALGECTVHLVQFDDVAIETVFDHRPVRDVPPLTSETFVPRGWTPLYDAVGHTIKRTGEFLKNEPENHRPAKVIFVIITDGLENHSREFTQQSVFEMIRHQTEAYKWQFVYLGANQDAMAVGASIGIARANAMTYAANDVGTQSAFASVSNNAARFRSGLNVCMSFSAEDREEQEKAKHKK